jgi:hypothetical protein
LNSKQRASRAAMSHDSPEGSSAECGRQMKQRVQQPPEGKHSAPALPKCAENIEI